MAHVTIKDETVLEEEVGGSRFIAFAKPVASLDEAFAFLAEVRELHPSATHHCHAFRVGEEQRFSDDGEPGGTAGRPMLEVILKRDLDRVATVVVRYYGGRKLGAGGLVRAYSGAVAKALDVAGEREVVDMARVLVSAPFAYVDTVVRTVDDIVSGFEGAFRGEPAFSSAGLEVSMLLPASELAAATKRLTEVTRGDATVTALQADGSEDGEGR